MKNLSDFVTAITPTYVSKAIYTGGRILSGQHKIYALCNNEIVIYSIKDKAVVQKIRHVNFHTKIRKMNKSLTLVWIQLKKVSSLTAIIT